MKSFAFGAAAALVAAYTIADTPEGVASSDRNYKLIHVSGSAMSKASFESAKRAERGTPPFWGRAGVVSY